MKMVDPRKIKPLEKLKEGTKKEEPPSAGDPIIAFPVGRGNTFEKDRNNKRDGECVFCGTKVDPYRCFSAEIGYIEKGTSGLAENIIVDIPLCPTCGKENNPVVNGRFKPSGKLKAIIIERIQDSV